MIDNPLPDQVMAEKDADALSQKLEAECKEHAKKVCEEHSVYPELIKHFQEWAWCICLDADSCLPSGGILDDGKEDINAWWDEEGDLYDDYISPYKDFDPTPDGDSPYSDAEYIITPEERNRMAFESKRESHGRGNPFNW
jgi:hypothetical protein